jgi:23S rRNA-/tRNA-specific pseudouridylate synthase
MQHQAVSAEVLRCAAVLPQIAVDYQSLATVEMPVGIGRYATSRYSLVELSPKSGRKHPLFGDSSTRL